MKPLKLATRRELSNMCVDVAGFTIGYDAHGIGRQIRKAREIGLKNLETRGDDELKDY